MKRRDFLITSLTASTAAWLGAGCAGTSAQTSSRSGARQKQEYYELRAYKMKPGARPDLLHQYLQHAAIPAWNRIGIKPVGVFLETEPKDPQTVFVLIPYPSLEHFASANTRLDGDPSYLAAGAGYLQTAKDNPAFERIDSWLMLAFAGMPKIELADYSRENKPRLFEMRTYESYSETKAQKKVDMFNDGEIDVMREVGLAPVFYGQALTGPNLPHLTYMTSAANDALHKEHWAAFGKHPKWDQMKNDPQYADTVSKITKWFLKPAPYSQI